MFQRIRSSLFGSLRRASVVLPAALALGAIAVGTAYWTLWRGESGSNSPEDPSGGPSALMQAELDRGRAAYEAICATCHGLRGEGQPNWYEKKPDGTYPAPPHDATGHTWHHADGLLFRIVRDGGSIAEVPEFKSAMPAFGDRLTSAEIRAVINYVKTFWGDSKTPWGDEKRAIQAEGSLQDPFPAD